jgi:putative DNA primase/helicase
MLWSELIERLRATHRTAETQAEYLSSKKTRRDEIKDVGGFVGGYLAGGSRKAGAVQHKSMLALDLDDAKKGFWPDFTLTFGFAALIYSTHSHTPDENRLRLIAPFDRITTPVEYEAVCRWVAGKMGIEMFDPTTFQAERLMYWPSSSKDAEYIFEYQDGPFLCVDKILAEYRNWQDSSEWPVSDKVDKIVQRNMVKQGDPLEKPGIIGAFCRTYSLHEAITNFLADVYEPCDTDNRYTYLHGSTAAGLITYDDKYAYSHHGSDPTGGKLCNAFDLVRLHKFGLQDEDALPKKGNSLLPSEAAMLDFAANIKEVKQLLITERLNSAKNDFAEGQTSNTKPDGFNEWLQNIDLDSYNEKLASLEVDRKANVLVTTYNFILILETIFEGLFAFDEFEQREIAKADLPWRKVTPQSKYLTDTDEANIRFTIEFLFKISNSNKLTDALNIVLKRHGFHPIKNYLNTLVWDGTPRADRLFIDYLGVEDNDYTKAVTRKTLCAAVARIMNPGVKFDYMLTLVGPQGVGKSTIVNKLGGAYHSDTMDITVKVYQHFTAKFTTHFCLL